MNREELIELRGKVEQAHKAIYAKVSKLREGVMSGDMTQEESVDLALTLRDMSKHLDDVRKECDKLTDTITNKVCAVFVRDNDVNDPEPNVKGRWGTATPDIGFSPSLPKRDTPEYLDFMFTLGVQEDSVTRDLVRPHWPGIRDALAEAAALAKPMPWNIEYSTNYKMAMRKGKHCPW